MKAKYTSTCKKCNQTIMKGDDIIYDKGSSFVSVHAACPPSSWGQTVLKEDTILDELPIIEKPQVPQPPNKMTTGTGPTYQSPVKVSTAVQETTPETVRAILEKFEQQFQRKLNAGLDQITRAALNAVNDAMPNKTDLQNQFTQAANSALAKANLAFNNHVEQAIDVLAKGAEDMVAKALEKLTPKTIEVKTPTGATVKIGTAHKHFESLLEILSEGMHAYLWGPPGSGKSTGARQAATALERRYGYIALNPMVTDVRLLGFIRPDGQYVRTDFRECFENGGLFCIDEMDNASGALLVTLNGALENGVCSFPDRQVQAHKTFLVCGTGNTSGRGATLDHSERRPFDAAFGSRFAYLEWGYDEELERSISIQLNPAAGNWVTWVLKMRESIAKHGLRILASPRSSFMGARLLRRGLPVPEVAEMVLFKGVDMETKAKLLRECPLPRVG